MALISVIIPYFNQGDVIGDAIESVLSQTFVDFEVIIIDDGSYEVDSIEKFDSIKNAKIKKIKQINSGVANARNAGIEIARGKYILPLDSDDKIGSSYLEKALSVIEGSPDIGIVYCKAEFFGRQTGEWKLPEFNIPDILVRPSIFVSALFRKSDWATVGGFSREMIYGWEDYDFWLSLIECGVKVYQIPETLFFYRKTVESSVDRIDREKAAFLYAKLFRRHTRLYSENIEFIFREMLGAPPRMLHPRLRVIVSIARPHTESDWTMIAEIPANGEARNIDIPMTQVSTGTDFQIRIESPAAKVEICQLSILSKSGSPSKLNLLRYFKPQGVVKISKTDSNIDFLTLTGSFIIDVRASTFPEEWEAINFSLRVDDRIEAVCGYLKKASPIRAIRNSLKWLDSRKF